MSVKVRFAPSPTGYVHIGSLRTALYNYLFAKKNNGTYVLRVEDTDQTRYVDGALENMLNMMSWAGLENQEGVKLVDGEIVQVGENGPYIQSERLSIYKDHIESLLAKGHAYYCFCSKERLEEVREKQKANNETPMYDGHCKNISLEEAKEKIANNESYVIRLKLPENHNITFEDVVRGKVTVNTNDLDDQVLMKSDGFPTYHFAVVVDDYLMGITHVIRGEEWVISTPKHAFLYEAFGWEAPKYVHLPNILNKDKKKLSKRQGDVAASDFKNKGYLPEGLINYLALVGWSPEDEQEIFNMEQLIESFTLERVSKSGGIFDTDKLNWINAHYVKDAEAADLVDLAGPYLIEKGYISAEDLINKREWLTDLMQLLKERIAYVKEVETEAELFFKDQVEMADADAEEIAKTPHMGELIEVFERELSQIDKIDIDFGKKTFKIIQKETGHKGKNLFMPMRVAITGEVHGPDMGLILKVLGKDNVMSRLDSFKTKYIKA